MFDLSCDVSCCSCTYCDVPLSNFPCKKDTDHSSYIVNVNLGLSVLYIFKNFVDVIIFV